MSTESTDTDTPTTDTAENEDFAAFERRASGREDEPQPEEGDEPSDAGEPETPEGDDPDGEEEAPEDEQPPRKGKTAKDRIDELTAARREAEREADYWRGVAEGRIKPDKGTDAGDDADKAEDPNPKPKAEDYEYGEADPEYIEARARWAARDEFETLKEKDRIDAAVDRIEGTWTERTQAVREEYPDFDEKVTRGADRGEWPCPPVVALGIKTSEAGPHIAYHLATNLDEAKRIAGLSPLEQARELGRLEGRFTSQKSDKDPAQAPPPKKIATDAPEPPPARARGAGGKFAVDDDTSDFAAFEAKHMRRR